MTESKWTSKLREMRFERVSPEREAIMERHTEARRQQLRDREPNRAAKRAFDAQWARIMNIPTFFVARTGEVIATDDFGQHWSGTQTGDLEAFGFKDVSNAGPMAAALFGGPADYTKINN